jgi:hypothetical protein
LMRALLNLLIQTIYQKSLPHIFLIGLKFISSEYPDLTSPNHNVLIFNQLSFHWKILKIYTKW